MPQTITSDEISDPTFGVPPIGDMAKRQSQLIQHFEARWTKEYLTSLHEYHKTTGTTKQLVKARDVVIVHDDIPKSKWKLAVVEKLMMALYVFKSSGV